MSRLGDRFAQRVSDSDAAARAGVTPCTPRPKNPKKNFTPRPDRRKSPPHRDLR
jgi:hypothetical protein